MKRTTLSIMAIGLVLIVSVACQQQPSGEAARTEAQTFLDDYTASYVELYAASSEAEWSANTRIVEGDDSNLQKVQAANEAFAAFTGSTEVIEAAQGLLAKKDQLEAIQTKQLEKVLYVAANNPQTVADVVSERIAAEAKQVELLFGYEYKIDGEPVTTNKIDEILTSSTDLDEMLEAWNASKEVGPTLRDGLSQLVGLRNQTVKAMGYDDYFAYQVSDYDMTAAEMMTLNEQLIREIWPLYRELHTWARYNLAERFKQPVPELLPAHWMPNRWGQDWAALVTVEGIDLDARLAEHDAEWVMRQSEEFYVSLGFDTLPQSFWNKSSLYPLPEGADYKKNNHASAWHIDLNEDIRSLMSVEPNERWWNTTHHELGHIYYYMSYTRPEVPPLLRAGANRGFHEAVGSLLGMASMQEAFLRQRGVLPEDGGDQRDEISALLKEALDTVVFMPFSAGTMTHFERDLYSGAVGDDAYNAHWWELVRRFQGIVPPGERGEQYCDPATKTHINNDAAQYYDYALSYVILHQLHAHIASEILAQDPRNTCYFGSTETGTFINDILKQGATGDWREVMQEAVGEGISAKPMLAYFEPLMQWLVEQNEGRTHALPEQPEM